MISLLGLLLLSGPNIGEPPMVVQPSWIQTPTGDDIGRVTPYLESPPAEVQVLMACRITGAGRLEACSIRSETPAGLGYGAAAVALAPAFRMPDVDMDGRPVAGRMVQIPIIWKNTPE